MLFQLLSFSDIRVDSLKILERIPIHDIIRWAVAKEDKNAKKATI